MEQIVKIADYAQLLTFGLAIFAFLPQWAVILKSRSVRDLSLNSWLLWSFSWVLSLFYAWTHFLINGTGWALAVTSSLSAICTYTTLFMIIYFRRKDSTSPETAVASVVKSVEEATAVLLDVSQQTDKANSSKCNFKEPAPTQENVTA